MAKFKLRMKLQGLEIEVEGDRQDVPLITSNLGQQFTALLEPSQSIVEGETTRKQVANVAAAPTPVPAKNAAKRARKAKRVDDGGDSTIAIDVAIWGEPLQAWKTESKAIWFLHMAELNSDAKRPLTASEITTAFNKHFSVAGILKASNVSRDLRKVKGGPTGLVVEIDDGFALTASGRVEGQRLVAEAKAGKATEMVEA